MKYTKEGLKLTKPELDALLAFACEDPERPNLYGVKFILTEDSLRARSTNGHIALDVVGHNDTKKENEWFVHRDFLKGAKKVLENSHTLTLKFSGASLTEAAVHNEEGVEVPNGKPVKAVTLNAEYLGLMSKVSKCAAATRTQTKARTTRLPSPMPHPPQCIAGIDPGYRKFAVAAVTRPNGRYEGWCRTVTTNSKQTEQKRLSLIGEALDELFTRKPDAVVIEDQTGVNAGMRRKGKGRNFGNAKVEGVMLMVKSRCVALGIPYLLLAPQTIKVAVCGRGGGRADKDRVRHAVKVLVGVELDEHSADATAAAIGGWQRVAVTLPGIEREFRKAVGDDA